MLRPALLLAILLGASSAHLPTTDGPRVVPNDNTRPAGRVRGAVHRVALVALGPGETYDFEYTPTSDVNRHE